MVREINQNSTPEHNLADQNDNDLMVLQERKVMVRQPWDFAAIEANALKSAIDEHFGSKRFG